MRRTSAEAYAKVLREGLLPKSRLRIYAWLYEYGPATAREVFAGIGTAPVQQTRFNELEAQGMIVDVGMRKCSITGHRSTRWDVTCNLPMKLPRRPRRSKPTKAEMGEAVAAMRKAWEHMTPGAVKTLRWLRDQSGIEIELPLFTAAELEECFRQ